MIVLGMCTGSFYESGRPSAGTKCVAPCVNESGRWGSNWCYTKDDKSQWGAECVTCTGKIHTPSKIRTLWIIV